MEVVMPKKKSSIPKPKKTKRNTKDSVFTHLFSFPQYQLELYQALHPEDGNVSESDIETITRECVVAQHPHNDLGILVKDTLMIFVEAQSSWSPNIVIRLMSYAIQSLTDYFREREIFLHSATKVTCPRIELYAIFSCEREEMPEFLSLRNEFFQNDERCDLDATVKVIQLEEGKTDIINQYIMFCRVFDAQIKLYGYTETAIRETLRICRNKGILAEYIKKRENEIMDIMETLFDQEYVTRMYGLEERRAGEREGEKKRNTEITRNLLQMNMDIEVIEKATGLSREEILKVKEGAE